MPIKRRTMLGLLSGSTFFLQVAPGGVSAAAPSTPLPKLKFPQGVASGDPQADAIMLWTRAVPPAEHTASVGLLLQVCKDESFERLEVQSLLTTDAASDYTVRTYIEGLQADTFYYYRFIGGDNSISRLGRTRTAPAVDQARKVNLAFASCQHYEQGHYGSWARMLADDKKAAPQERIDFVLHLGDFIYERNWNTRRDGSPISRKVPAFPDGVVTEQNSFAVSLEDYRLLYKTYLSDPHLQEARALWPFVCTWDDHEFANNNFQGYNTYSGKAEAQAQRKQSSNQAWFEYIPALLDELKQQPAHDFKGETLEGDEEAQNLAAINSLCIYRQLRYGKYVDVILTDCRSYRTPDCLEPGFAASLGTPLAPVELVAIADAGKSYNNGNPPDLLPFGDGTTANPAKDREPGSVLGLEQRSWFLARLSASNATWKLWGNALPLVPMRLDMSALPFTGYEDAIFNIDSWAGYPYEVHYIMQQVEAQKITGLISLSGDHHMHAAGTVQRSTTDDNARPVAADFSVAGISSAPIFEELLWVAKEPHTEFAPLVYSEAEDGLEPVWNMTLMDGVLASYTYSQSGVSTLANWLGPNTANPGLRYVDSTANGYGLASFDANEMNVHMVTLEDCRPNFTQPPAIAHIARFTLPLWKANDGPQLSGPEFIGGAPFPFDPPKV